MTKAKDLDKQDAITTLIDGYGLKPGDKVYTKVTHVARSGMSRSIDAYLSVIDDNGKADIVCISWLIAKLDIGTFDRNNGRVKMGGCGMDMTFALVYNLGRTLWPNGFKTWKGYWRNEPLEFEPDGGYALKNVNI